MIDPKLEEQISATQQLLQIWQRFHEYFTFGLKGTDIDAQREREFLQIKSQIALLHDTFMEALEHDLNIGQNIMSIASRCITLKGLKKLSNADVQKLEIEWHESYLLLNETVSALQEKRQQIASINPHLFKLKKSLKLLGVRLKNLTGQVWFKALAIVIVIVAAVVGLFAFGVINPDMLKQNRYTQPLYNSLMKAAKRFSSSVPFDSFNEVPRDKSWPGQPVKLESAIWGPSAVVNIFLPKFGVVDSDGQINATLARQLAVNYEQESRPGDPATPVAEVIMIRFPDVASASAFTWRVTSKYEEYLNQNPSIPRLMQVFSIRNIAVLVGSADSNLSRDIRQREFKQ
ncbi:MAG: hypothetical protein Kow0059_06710 [Candidatus Sumerlaeia bacterium]